jgi:hypothetical protein
MRCNADLALEATSRRSRHLGKLFQLPTQNTETLTVRVAASANYPHSGVEQHVIPLVLTNHQRSII